MKRFGDLFGKIVYAENLVDAAYKASRGKRKRPDVVSFSRHLIDEVIRLQRELQNGTYRPGGYREFFIYEGKPRRISAAPFRDRVVHHALCNVIMPILGKSYIDNTFANRKWKGTHRAVKLSRRYCRRHEKGLPLGNLTSQYFANLYLSPLDHFVKETLGVKAYIRYNA